MKSKNGFRLLLLLLMAIIGIGAVQAQNITVKGIVTDAADNSPLPGVNVIVKGTATGTITNFDGQYEIKANAGDILLFSFIGYSSYEAPAAATLNVALNADVTNLEDVVVIGYGVARKNDLTGSVTAIKPDELNKGMVTNAQDMMQGKIAGVSVTSASGAPGAGATIRVRGGSSLNASNDPLIVIDGLAMDNNGVKGLSNPLSMVNPADIETFTVLKDASATAIYGSRGSNGVIIITTKKGKAGQNLQVSYNGSVGFSVKKKLRETMSGDEFAQYITDLYGADSEAVANLGYAKEGETPVIYNTDWQEEIYRTALSTDHNVTLAGSAASMPYRISLGYTGQQGILDTSDFRRGTASINVSPKFLEEHLSVNASAKLMYAKTIYANTDAIGASLRMDPTKPVYAAADDARYNHFGGYFQWALWGKGAFSDPEWLDSNNTLAPGNPRALLDLKDDSAISKSFIGNAEIDYKFHGFEDLRAHINLGGDWSTGKQTTVISPNSTSDYYYGWDGWDKIDKNNLSLSAYLQYSHDFDSANQHFDIMGGYEWQKFHREGKSLGSGFYQPTHSQYPDEKYNEKPNSWATENFIVSFFGRANYSLLDRYLLTATVRYDGSSRFQDHWALFPSVALGWRIKEEAFLKDIDVVSDMKVRLGYGQTGQQEGIGDYNYFASFHASPNADYYYSVVPSKEGIGSMYRPNAYNPELSWETTTTYNVGLDFGFLDQRINGSIDLYKRETTDLINTVSVPVGTNFKNKVTSNIGSLVNKGVEIALNGKVISTNDITWELGVNYTYNDNEVTELIGDESYFVETGGISAGTGSTCQAHIKGHPINSFLVYQQAYDENGKMLEGVVVDRNGDNMINEADKYIYKQAAAPITLGFSSRLQVKNFDFSFSLRSSIGNYVYNDVSCDRANVSSSTMWLNGYLTNTIKEAVENGCQTNSMQRILSDYYVQNASFLKCDNITLGYSFNKLFGKLNGRVYVAGTNVFTITKYDGIDPEVNGGIDNSIYPRPFTGLLGLSLNF